MSDDGAGGAGGSGGSCGFIVAGISGDPISSSSTSKPPVPLDGVEHTTGGVIGGCGCVAGMGVNIGGCGVELVLLPVIDSSSIVIGSGGAVIVVIVVQSWSLNPMNCIQLDVFQSSLSHAFKSTALEPSCSNLWLNSGDFFGHTMKVVRHAKGKPGTTDILEPTRAPTQLYT